MPLPFALVPQHFGSLVFDRRAARYLPFDQAATRLLVALAERPLDAVLADIVDTGERSVCAAFADYFYGQGLFGFDGRLLADVVPVDAVPVEHLVGPLVTHVELTGVCNLTCTHCFAGELPRHQHPLQVHEFATLFADLARIGCFRVNLTGGEPLLRHDVLAIIDAALDHGLRPALTTNGLLLTEELARGLGQRDLVWLNVSLEGPTPAINDAVRGAGTFDGVLAKLALLRRHARFSLAFTITRQNAAYTRECVDLAKQVGADAAVFRPLYPTGVALQHLDLMPDQEQYLAALAAVTEPQAFGPSTRAEAAILPIVQACGAGTTVASVSVQGDVNPCSFLGSSFVVGNIRTRSFADLWNHGHAMRRLRTDEGEFTGGCRARALVYNGSENAIDPWQQPSRALGRRPLPVIVG